MLHQPRCIAINLRWFSLFRMRAFNKLEFSWLKCSLSLCSSGSVRKYDFSFPNPSASFRILFISSFYLLPSVSNRLRYLFMSSRGRLASIPSDIFSLFKKPFAFSTNGWCSWIVYSGNYTQISNVASLLAGEGESWRDANLMGGNMVPC